MGNSNNNNNNNDTSGLASDDPQQISMNNLDVQEDDRSGLLGRNLNLNDRESRAIVQIWFDDAVAEQRRLSGLVNQPRTPEETSEFNAMVAQADRAVAHYYDMLVSAGGSGTVGEVHPTKQFCKWHNRIAWHSSDQCTRGHRLTAQGYTEPPVRISRTARREAAASHGRGQGRGGRGGARRGGRGRGRGRGGRGGNQQGATT
ncbi:hypothetical protein D6C76_09596 [Aureobasidium pullulans]|nr:hypothetical protein D6C76_09596 [Aureobasidium pullulans]